MSTTYRVMGTTPLGLEAIAAREIRQLGYECTVENGRLDFQTDSKGIARCNLWLRTVDRILIVVGEFTATTFDDLFEGTKALPWSDLLPRDARFPVEGRSVKSQLSSVPACQSIVKKAIVDKLQQRHGEGWLSESGDLYPLEVSILKDVVTITLDTSGAGLHKRGYRTKNGPAPIKETLAAALVLLSRWEPHRPFADILCGTGTIAIEAAMYGRQVAPGLYRSFSAEHFDFLEEGIFDEIRKEAQSKVLPKSDVPILAYDLDPQAIELAQYHARQAGVEDSITFNVQEAAVFYPKIDYGCLISNPPYGERLGDDQSVRCLYQELGQVAKVLPTWSFFIITSHPQFERLFGKRAEKKRKLYNARMECQYYQYLGPLPPRQKPATP